MTVGSVRGKQRLEMPFLVAHGGLSIGFEGLALVVEPTAPLRSAESFGGQVRLPPALTDMVGWPQPPQKGFRAFQSRRARAWA